LNFFPRVTAEALRAIIGSKSAISLQCGPVYPKFRVERVAPTNHSSSQKTRINDQGWVFAMAKTTFAGTVEKNGKNRCKNRQKLWCSYIILPISYYVSLSHFIGCCIISCII